MQLNFKDSIISNRGVAAACLVVAVGAGATACATAPVRPDPVATATAAEQAHCDKPLAEDPRIFSPEVVTSVSPLTRSYPFGKSERTVLAGSQIVIPAQPGWTAEWITRNLICHQADLLLGRASAPHDDAYWLPGRWLEFGVRSRGDAFVVEIDAPDPESANAVLARSRALLAHRVAAP